MDRTHHARNRGAPRCLRAPRSFDLAVAPPPLENRPQTADGYGVQFPREHFIPGGQSDGPLHSIRGAIVADALTEIPTPTPPGWAAAGGASTAFGSMQNAPTPFAVEGGDLRMATAW